MPVAEVANLNTALINEATGGVILPDGQSGVAQSVANLSNQLINFVVASTTYQIKLQDLNFDNGLLGILKVFLESNVYTVTDITRPQQDYDGMIVIEFTDDGSNTITMTIESDRISGRLLFKFE